MGAFSAEVKAAGGRALPLKVKGAFHSPFMNGAAEEFALEVARAELHAPAIPLYSNTTGEPYTDDIAGLLSGQICHPVQWEALVRRMIADGVDTFIEIGPGRTLANMIKKIRGQVRALTATEYLTEAEGC